MKKVTPTVVLRKKEAELLEFTEKLTEKNVTLQSDFNDLEARAAGLEEEHQRLAAAHARTEARLTEVLAELEVESSQRREETELLARKLAQATREATASAQQARTFQL